MRQKKSVRTVADAERAIVKFLRELIAQGDGVDRVHTMTTRTFTWYNTRFRGREVAVGGEYRIGIDNRFMPSGVNAAVGRQLFVFLSRQVERQHEAWKRSERRRPAQELKRLANELLAAS